MKTSGGRAVLALGAAAAIGWLGYTLAHSDPAGTIAFPVYVDDTAHLVATTSGSVAVAPDGAWFVYVGAAASGATQLFVWRDDDIAVHPLPDTDGAVGPFISPDGAWIGFDANGSLKRVAIRGGPAIEICRLDGALRGANWSDDDEIYFGVAPGTAGSRQPIRRVRASGGTPIAVTEPGADEPQHEWPQLLPNHDGLLYTSTVDDSGAASMRMWVQSLNTGHAQLVAQAGRGQYIAAGYLVFAVPTGVEAVPFDPVSVRVTGPAQSIATGVLTTGGTAHFAVSRTGTLVVVTDPVERTPTPAELVWVDRHGVETPATAHALAYRTVDLAPDGRKVAVQIGIGLTARAMVIDLAHDALQPIAFDGISTQPVWTPDGGRIVFRGRPATEATSHPFAVSGDGRGAPEAPSVVPVPGTAATDSGVFDYFALDGTRGVQRLPKSPRKRLLPRLSPDGRWLAYAWFNGSGTDVYVDAYPSLSDPHCVSVGGGTMPRWSRDGRHLFYLSDLPNDGRIVDVSIGPAPGFHAGAPITIVEGPYGLAFDAASDGERFLIVKLSPTPPPHLEVTLNRFR